MISFIKEYIEKLDKDYVNGYLIKQDIYLSKDELEIVYYHLKNNWYDFIYKNNKNILEDMQKNLSEINFNKLYDLYINALNTYGHYL